MLSAADTWANPMQTFRGSAAPTVTLFPSEPYAANNNENLPLRSTTYDAKYINSAPFSSGSLYIQEPLSNHQVTAKLELGRLSLPQVYTVGYRAFIERQKLRDRLSFSFPPAPPDFDSNTPANPQLVAQYVRGLATAYSSVRENPTPFQMYQQLICDVAAELMTGHTDSGCSSDAHRGVNSNAVPTEQDDVGLTYADAFFQGNFDAQPEGDVLAISLALTSLSELNRRYVQVLLSKLCARPQVAPAISQEVVGDALVLFEDCISDAQRTTAVKGELISLIGIIVCSRGRIDEVITFLRIVEQFALEKEMVLPHAKEMMSIFSPHTAALCPVVSPVDCYQEEPRTLGVPLWEGTSVQCFGASLDGQLLAVATSRGLTVFSVGSSTVLAELELPESKLPLWHLMFSEDAKYIIGTDVSGLNHTIFSTDLTTVHERSTIDVAVALGVDSTPDGAGELVFLPPPFLPHGRTHSIYLHHVSSCLVHVHDLQDTPTEHFTVCSHVHRDYTGLVVQFLTETGELAVHVEEDVVVLSQNGMRCYGAMPASASWLLLQVQWNKGTWSLSLNAQMIELCGPRSGQLRSVVLRSAMCFGGRGHVGSLCAWAGESDLIAAQNYFQYRSIDCSLKGLLNIPLDEGEGLWLKECVASTCHIVDETAFVWDTSLSVPCFNRNCARSTGAGISAASVRHVSVSAGTRLDARVMLGGKVLASAFRLFLLLPSADAGSDGVVAEVDRSSNTIVHVYRCPRACVRDTYALLSDESAMMQYQRRFSTFKRVRLHTARNREQTLAAAGLLESTSAPGTAGWLLHCIYKAFYVQSMELQRVPLESSPLRLYNLQVLRDILGDVTANTNPLKVLAVMSLSLVHLKRLRNVDEVCVSDIATSIKRSCEAIGTLFSGDAAIHRATADLLDVATEASFTLDDRAQLLVSEEEKETKEESKTDSNSTSVPHGACADCLYRYVLKESVFDVVKYIVAHYPVKLVPAVTRLLAKCAKEAKSDQKRSLTQRMPPFIVSCVCALFAQARLEDITALLRVLMEHTHSTIKNGILDSPEQLNQTSLLTAVMPALIVAADLCPSAVDDTVEEALLSLLSALAGVCDAPHLLRSSGQSSRSAVVTFTIQEACDVYPPRGEGGAQAWRFLRDFTKATSVSVLKDEAPGSSVTIVHTDDNLGTPVLTLINHETPFVKLNGGNVILFGSGECTFTLVTQYDFNVDVTWATLLAEASTHLLVRYASALTERVKLNTDVYISPLMRHGLTSTALRRHSVDIAGRELSSSSSTAFALTLLENTGDGKEFVDRVCAKMRGSIVPSMRPAIQALLAILIHSGASMQQAEDELKLRWFSGEWGSKLQGPTREATQKFLIDFARWATTSFYFQAENSAKYARRPSLERRGDGSITNNNASRSTSERRGSTSSRRSFIKNFFHLDVLDQVRTLLSREVAPPQLEQALVERTRLAMRMTKGLSVLTRVVSQSHTTGAHTLLFSVLEALWRFADVDAGGHYIELVSGAGFDLEMKVRTAFHSVLEKCGCLLLDSSPKDIPLQSVLSDCAVHGKATMQLLAILCHPWDIVDCGLLSAQYGREGDTLWRLDQQVNISTGNLTLASPWRFGNEMPAEISEREERALMGEYMGAADLTSLSHIFPNDFSVRIPQFRTSRSEEGIAIEKNSVTAAVIRADEGWPLGWKDGVPRIFYFEVKLSSKMGKLEVGLGTFTRSGRGELAYMYESSGSTHLTQLPSFSDGDTVGCGVVATSRRVFFTLNGEFLAFVGCVEETKDTVYPALRFDETAQVQVLVNFGTSPFYFDFRMLHPSMCMRYGPTWYRVASTAAITLHYITTRACIVQESKRPEAKVFLAYCCEVACKNVNKVTSALMNIGVGGMAKSDAGTRIKQSVVLSVAEYSIMLLIATMRQIVCRCTLLNSQLPSAVSEMIFDAASVLMLLPLHSVQISTISLLPDVIPHIRAVPDSATCSNLVRTLFDHANEGTEQRETIPYVPMWAECDPECMSIANVQLAHMVPETQRSIVLGGVLPRVGVVSFSVKITRRNMSKGHSLKGGYFIGVSIPGLTPLSPMSNSQSWKAVKPPVVWALHDTSPQLPHATNPTVKSNNFQRTFGSGDVIRVVVDREKRIIDFYRDDEFLKTLFSSIPADTDLVPFVQLYNDDAAAVITPGTMTAPMSAPTLLSASSVDVLRSMLTLEPFQHLVADGLCKELDTQRHPRVTLALFNSIADPRVFQLRSTLGDDLLVTVTRINDMRCKFSIGDATNYEHLYNLRTPARPKIMCPFDAQVSLTSLDGLSECVNKVVQAVVRLTMPLLTLDALNRIEMDERQLIMEDEQQHWDYLFYGVRTSAFIAIQKGSEMIPLIQTPKIPNDYTFSAHLSYPSLFLSPHYCGRLVTMLSGTKNATAPFIAIAEPSIPSEGRFSIRCQLLRGHNGQILGGGYYFGVCMASFNWRRKELITSVPDVWAIHDLDDDPWRLRHMHPSATFAIAADPRCILVSGDIIRLEINRDEGTIYAFRKPLSGDEIALGLIYDNLPSGDLYPFVQLFNTDAVAVLLPSNSTDPAIRMTVQQPHYALRANHERRCCDGCASQRLENRLPTKWYRCNECVDYALCKTCFDTCLHSYHAFTEMGEALVLHSRAPPTALTAGMEVSVPASNSMYLRSSGCTVPEEHMNCMVEAVDDNAFAIWGLVCKGKGQFTMVVDTINGDPLSVEQPVFVGLGAVEELVSLSYDKLRTKCLSPSSSLVTFCSDPTMRQKLDNERRHPYGFSNNSTITFDVDLTKFTVTILRDWIVVGTRPIEFSSSAAAAMNFPVCCFVLLGKKGTRVSVKPERCDTFVGKVDIINDRIACVSLADRRLRYVPIDNCRVPLRSCTMQPPIGRLGYTFVNKRMVQCRVVSTDTLRQGEVNVVYVNQHTPSAAPIQLPLHHLFIDSDDLLAEERPAVSDSGESSATLEDGFVISRLLLILSCLCENETLAPLVALYSNQLSYVISGLASVQLMNDAPLDFIEEIRSFVAGTANAMRFLNPAQRLGSFVPTLGIGERRHMYKPGLLVQPILGGTAPFSGLHRVVSRRGENVSLKNVATGETCTTSRKMCLPVKQCAGRPWHTLPNGLPWCRLEHTLRVTDAAMAATDVSVAGNWQGEISMTDNKNIGVELDLAEGGYGVAKIRTSHQELEVYVLYEHKRYHRTLRCTLLPQNLVPPELWQRVASENAMGLRALCEGWRDSTTNGSELRKVAHPVSEKAYAVVDGKVVEGAQVSTGGDERLSSSATPCLPYDQMMNLVMSATDSQNADNVYYIDADVDWEGLRMGGVCRRKYGTDGTFTATSTRRMSFAPLTTDIMNVEPLPDCTEVVIPPLQQRDMTTMICRLIVLLARHLYLVVCTQTNSMSKKLSEHIFHFATHPLADYVVSNLIGAAELDFMVCEAYQLILAPAIKPWDAATISKLIIRSLLLSPVALAETAESFVWDVLHAVVVAAHRCGSNYRHEIIRSLTAFQEMEAARCFTQAHAYRQLFSTLFSYFDRNVLPATITCEVRKDIAAGVDLVLLSQDSLVQSSVRNIPIKPLHCLIDIWQSISGQCKPLPLVVQYEGSCFSCSSDGFESASEDDAEISAVCAFGDYERSVLKVGKVMSSCVTGATGRFYYEVTLPDRLTSVFAAGWGTTMHSDVPSQHVGCDNASFSFNGTNVTTREFGNEYKIDGKSALSSSGRVIGCLLDMNERTCAWSMNGTVGPFISIPITCDDNGLHAFVSIGTSTGMRIHLNAREFMYAPDGYTDLLGRYTRVQVNDYDSAKRSSLPLQSIVFYEQMASFVSDVEEHKTQQELKLQQQGASMNMSLSTLLVSEEPCTVFLRRYSLLSSLTPEAVQQHKHVLEVIESCMATANRFVDLEGEQVSGSLSLAFVYLKSSVRRSFRRKNLVNIPPVRKNATPPLITIRVSELYSTLARTPEVALQHTVLAQLHKQIGAFIEAQWSLDPLFKVNLYISGSRHAPIDMGGPYRQLWTFVADEIMRHPDRCFPHSDFHRNPLFNFVNNSQRVSLVPDSLANSPFELALLNFFGKLLGYAARAMSPLDIDFSPFMWKFLVDDTLSIHDYYRYVDSVVEKSIGDDNFLMNGMAEEIIPDFGDRILWIEEDDIGDDVEIAQRRRAIAENCLVHSMDEQLSAIRSGLWATLPRRIVRTLAWRDLERLVCGKTNPTIDMLKRYIHTTLSSAREKYFWDIVAELTGEQKASLLCFASGQRRLPLIQPITVIENSESVEHLPRAQSCSSLIAIPPYPTFELFRKKLMIALQHQMEMELA